MVLTVAGMPSAMGSWARHLTVGAPLTSGMAMPCFNTRSEECQEQPVFGKTCGLFRLLYRHDHKFLAVIHEVGTGGPVQLWYGAIAAHDRGSFRGCLKSHPLCQDRAPTSPAYPRLLQALAGLRLSFKGCRYAA